MLTLCKQQRDVSIYLDIGWGGCCRDKVREEGGEVCGWEVSAGGWSKFLGMGEGVGCGKMGDIRESVDTEDWVGRYFLQRVGVGVLVRGKRNSAPGMREGGGGRKLKEKCWRMMSEI